MRFSEEDIAGIRKVLAAIVHLGNVDFTGPKDGHFSRVTNQKQVSGVHVCEWVTKFKCVWEHMYFRAVSLPGRYKNVFW